MQTQLQQTGGMDQGNAHELAGMKQAYKEASEKVWQLEQSNKDLERRLQSTSQKLSGSNSKLKEVVARFRALKEQNVKLKQKIERFRTQVKQGRRGAAVTAPASEASRRHAPPAAVRASLTTPGMQTFPDTPSAF